MASSTLFSQLLAISGASAEITRVVSDLGWPPVAMLIAMMALVFLFCLFIDPLWFWLLMLLNVTVGGITPPFGYAMFAFRGAAPDVPMNALFAAAWPFVGLFIVVMIVVGVVPELATWLPGLL